MKQRIVLIHDNIFEIEEEEEEKSEERGSVCVLESPKENILSITVKVTKVTNMPRHIFKTNIYRI